MVVVWVLAGAALMWGTAWTAPGLNNYQGRLTDSSGHAITTPVNVTFTFWDADAGGTQLGAGFSDTDTVTPDADGNYSTLIGDDPNNLIPPSVFSGDSVWLNVNVGGEDLIPRMRITSVGFALEAASAGHASTADTAASANEATHATSADSAATATAADNAALLGGLAASGFLQMSSDAYVVVKTTSNAAQNGASLLAACAAAKALTPNGAPLAATNRAAVLVPPGNYDLGSGSLALDTDYVDLIGLSSAREDQTIYGASNVLVQTASDVRIENLVLQYTGVSYSIYAYDPNATWNDGTSHTGSPPATVIRNCQFKATYNSMRDYVEYAGTYEDCAGGAYAFGAGGTASGTFTGCTGGDNAFAAAGAANGAFTNCSGGIDAFGGNNGGASGVFTNCTGGDYAFGGRGGMASGTFTNCTGGIDAFGGEGNASGTFIGCAGGTDALGGAGTASGKFTDCAGGNNAFGGGSGGTASGTFTSCTGAINAFGGYAGTASGTFTNCTGGTYAFGGYNGSASGGKFYHCVGGAGAFTETGSPAPVQLFCIQNGTQYAGNN